MKKEEYITRNGFELAGDTDEGKCIPHAHQPMIIL
jgi:hypothetical protein